MAKMIGPKGWKHGQIEHRLLQTASTAPLSYDSGTHSCDACLSKGVSVQRFFGFEKLLISPAAVDLSRVLVGAAPLLDAHQGNSITNVLGRISETWFKDGALWGRLVFAETAQGAVAEGMVSRGEITGISIGGAMMTISPSPRSNGVSLRPALPRSRRISRHLYAA